MHPYLEPLSDTGRLKSLKVALSKQTVTYRETVSEWIGMFSLVVLMSLMLYNHKVHHLRRLAFQLYIMYFG